MYIRHVYIQIRYRNINFVFRLYISIIFIISAHHFAGIENTNKISNHGRIAKLKVERSRGLEILYITYTKYFESLINEGKAQ